MLKFRCFVCGILLALLALATALVTLAPSEAYAEELTTITVEGTSRAASQSDAVKEIMAWATSVTARDLILEAVGEAKFEKSKNEIDSKLMKQSVKFIPVATAGKPVRMSDGSWKMPVEMRVAPSSLRKMILEAGIVDPNEGLAKVLPMIAIVDRTRGESIRWWTTTGKADAWLAGIHRVINDQLQREFKTQGFVIVKPQMPKAGTEAAEALTNERPDRNQLETIGEGYKTEMVLRGDVRITSSRTTNEAYILTLNLGVVHAANGRLIAEVEREIETKVGDFDVVIKSAVGPQGAQYAQYAKDLAKQVAESWQSGKLNAKRVRLALKGTLNPKELSTFKATLSSRIKEVKDIKERLFSGNEIVLELDYTGGLKDLALRLKSMQLPGFDTRLTEATTKTLTLDVKPRM